MWRAFESLHSEGKVSLLGISNCYDPADLEALFEAASVKPAVVQNRFYPGSGRALCALPQAPSCDGIRPSAVSAWQSALGSQRLAISAGRS